MGMILRRVPSRIQQLIEGRPILLVTIFLRSINDGLGSRNVPLEEELLQLD